MARDRSGQISTDGETPPTRGKSWPGCCAACVAAMPASDVTSPWGELEGGGAHRGARRPDVGACHSSSMPQASWQLFPSALQGRTRTICRASRPSK